MRLRRLGSWLVLNPLALVAIALAYGAGALTMMPMGFRVTPEVSSLMAAAIGAVAGVGGALSVVLATEFLQGRNIADYVVASYSPLLEHLGFVEGVIEGFGAVAADANWTPEQWSILIKRAREAKAQLDTTQNRIRRIEPNIYRLKARALHLLNVLSDDARDVEIAIDGVLSYGGRNGVMFYGAKLDAQVRAALATATATLVDRLDEMRSEYGSPGS